jgi:osmoprotectant transport system substrate-binding protein
MKKLMMVLLSALLMVSVAACSKSSNADSKAKKPTVIVGSKDNTEADLMGEMYAQILEDMGIKVERKLHLGGTAPTYEALKKGDLSLYPEYTGTALTVQFKQPINRDQAAVLKYIRDEFKKINMEFLDPAKENSTYGLAVKKEIASKYNLETISDLALHSQDLVFSYPQEFDIREDALPGLQKLYKDQGGFKFKKQFQIDYNLRYKPLLDGQSDVTVVIGTDGQIAGYALKLLKDDKNFFPIYNVAPLVRKDIIDAYPKMKERLNELAPFLTDEGIQKLNWEVDGPDKKEIKDVAKAFLKENKLIK